MESKIKIKECVDNKDRKFGSSLKYYPCKIVKEDGTMVNALFTDKQLDIAIERANVNPEDIPERKKGLFSIFF